jgi:hypothetical protein
MQRGYFRFGRRIQAVVQRRVTDDRFRLVAVSLCGPLNVCCAPQSSHLAAHQSTSPSQQGRRICTAQSALAQVFVCSEISVERLQTLAGVPLNIGC